MKDFELLKRTYPVSQHERNCDGWDYIASNSTIEERKEWKIKLNQLQSTIKVGEEYITKWRKKVLSLK